MFSFGKDQKVTVVMPKFSSFISWKMWKMKNVRLLDPKTSEECVCDWAKHARPPLKYTKPAGGIKVRHDNLFLERGSVFCPMMLL